MEGEALKSSGSSSLVPGGASLLSASQVQMSAVHLILVISAELRFTIFNTVGSLQPIIISQAKLHLLYRKTYKIHTNTYQYTILQYCNQALKT